MLKERKKYMKNLFKKKYILLTLTALFIMGSTTVFAAGKHKNIFDIIRNAFSAKTETVIDDTGREMDQIGSDSSADIKNYINDSYAQAIADIEAYKNSEIARGKKEIDDYVNEFKKQFSSVVADEKSKLQQKITEKVDNEIARIENDLDKDTEKYIKDVFK